MSGSGTSLADIIRLAKHRIKDTLGLNSVYGRKELESYGRASYMDNLNNPVPFITSAGPEKRQALIDNYVQPRLEQLVASMPVAGSVISSLAKGNTLKHLVGKFFVRVDNPNAVLPKTDEYLYHYTTKDAISSIAASGIKIKTPHFERGTGAGKAIYGLTQSNPDIFDNGIMRDVLGTNYADWRILRFKRKGRWRSDPEWLEDGYSKMRRRPVPPEDVEILTTKGWVPLKK